jgi:hypothetical protein
MDSHHYHHHHHHHHQNTHMNGFPNWTWHVLSLLPFFANPICNWASERIRTIAGDDPYYSSCSYVIIQSRPDLWSRTQLTKYSDLAFPKFQ